MSKKQELYCYLRVSSKVQEEEGNSIENQMYLGKRVSKKLDMKFVEMNEGHYSTTKETRPKLEELKEGIRIGRIKNVWYYTRSRWTRNVIEDLLIKKNYFIPYKTNVYEGESGNKRNFTDPKDEMLDTILTTVQQFDRQQRREISVGGKRHLSRTLGETGVFMGGTINFGYSNVDRKWVVNDEESKWVKKIFSLYLQGTSLKNIKSFLDTKGVRPRRSNTWSLGTLLTMLKNRVYLGEYKWVDKESEEEFIIVVPQIISHSLFNRVQKRRERNVRNRGNHSRQYESLLSDFLSCYCGENITGNIRKTVGKRVYICSSKHNQWKGKVVEFCENRRGMNMDKTDDFVIGKVKDVVGNSSLLKERTRTDVLSNKGLETKEIESDKRTLERGIKLLDEQIDLTVKSISSNEVNKMLKKVEDRVYKQVKTTLEVELSTLEDKKKGYIQEIEDKDNQKEWVDWVSQYGEELNKNFDSVNTEFLDGFIEDIVVSPTFDENRDGKRVQVGHKLNVNFRLPIVNDRIEYLNPKNKSKGYNLVDGKNNKEVGTVLINKGGRGKKKQ